MSLVASNLKKKTKYTMCFFLARVLHTSFFLFLCSGWCQQETTLELISAYIEDTNMFVNHAAESVTRRDLHCRQQITYSIFKKLRAVLSSPHPETKNKKNDVCITSPSYTHIVFFVFFFREAANKDNPGIEFRL